MIKKILVFLAICCTITLTFSALSSEMALAKDTTSYVDDTCNNFLGFNSWNCGVTITNDQESLKSGIWTIAANVLVDITVAAAYLVLGYVIYGGYQYIFSYGDPGKVATGKKTLAQAFIGLAIVMSANLIMSTIRFVLLDAGGKLNCDPTSGTGCVDGGAMVTNALQWVIGTAGVVSVIFIVYGGIAYISSTGEPAKLQKAKSVITYALIGLAIVALSEIITAFVSDMIRKADEGAGYNNQTIISKEVHEIHQIN